MAPPTVIPLRPGSRPGSVVSRSAGGGAPKSSSSQTRGKAGPTTPVKSSSTRKQAAASTPAPRTSTGAGPGSATVRPRGSPPQQPQPKRSRPAPASAGPPGPRPEGGAETVSAAERSDANATQESGIETQSEAPTQDDQAEPLVVDLDVDQPGPPANDEPENVPVADADADTQEVVEQPENNDGRMPWDIDPRQFPAQAAFESWLPDDPEDIPPWDVSPAQFNDFYRDFMRLVSTLS